MMWAASKKPQKTKVRVHSASYRGWFEKRRAPLHLIDRLVLFWVRPPGLLLRRTRYRHAGPFPSPTLCALPDRHTLTTHGTIAPNRLHPIRDPLISCGRSFAMGNARAGLEAITGLLAPLMAGGACLQSSLSIETTALTFSGCYQQSMYAGLYETLVWTIAGRDIAPTGTKAISASHVSKFRGRIPRYMLLNTRGSISRRVITSALLYFFAISESRQAS